MEAGARKAEEEQAGSGGVVDMTATVDESSGRVFELPSNDPFLPELHQLGNSLDSITEHLAPTKDGVKFYPKSMVRNPSPSLKRLCSRLEEKYNTDSQTLVYLANSLAVTFSISSVPSVPDKHPPHTVCDVIVLSEHAPVLILTVATRTSADTEEYNLNIAKGLVSSVRNFTGEHFSALCGVLEETDLDSPVTFDSALAEISRMSSSFCNPDSLSMTEVKFKHILRALAASASVSKGVQIVKSSNAEAGVEARRDEGEDEEDLWFLTKEQFLLLTENLDTWEEVVVWAGPRTGSSTLMVEVASRLERSGRTLLVSASQRLCDTAREHKVCYRIVRRDDFLATQRETGGMLEGVEHVVAEDVPETLLLQEGRKVHTWLCLKVKEKTIPSVMSPSTKTPIFTSGNVSAQERAPAATARTPVYMSGTGSLPKQARSVRGAPVASARPPVFTSGSAGSDTRAPVASMSSNKPRLLDSISFHLAGDTKDPWVYDFLVLTVNKTSVIVAVDFANSKVKTFHTEKGELVSGSMTIDKDVHGITKLGDMVAVTVPPSRIIRVIEVTPDLKPNSVIRTERRYTDIASLGHNKIAACAPKDGFPCIDFIDYTGKIYQSITRDPEGQSLFIHPLVIEPVSSTTVLVYDKELSSVLCVTDRGHVLYRYSPDRKLKSPCGMTVAPTGEVLVADSGQQRVTLLDRKGNYVRDVLTRRDDNIIYPYRVSCDNEGRMYVALFYKELKIFDFT